MFCLSSAVLQGSSIKEENKIQVSLVLLGRAHEHADRRRGLVVSRRVLEYCVCVVDPEQRRDCRGPDVEDPGVRDLAVNLHHHLVIFVPYDALWDGKRKGNRTVSSPHISK